MSGNDLDKNKPLILKDEEGLVLDHDYDGIQELDHPLPNWWLGLFYATIIFSLVYASYYLTGIGPDLREELESELKVIEVAKREAQANAPTAADNGNAAYLASLKDPEKLKNGLAVFTGKCAACHGDKAQGLIGPNLTDDAWLHGKGTPADVAKVIHDGVGEKGMPPWGSILTPQELVDVTAYIRSLHGSNPAGAKEAQGDIQPWQEI